MKRSKETYLEKQDKEFDELVEKRHKQIVDEWWEECEVIKQQSNDNIKNINKLKI